MPPCPLDVAFSLAASNPGSVEVPHPARAASLQVSAQARAATLGSMMGTLQKELDAEGAAHRADLHKLARLRCPLRLTSGHRSQLL